MKVNILIYVFVVIVSFASINSMVTVPVKQFCGRKLSDALAFLCPYQDHVKRTYDGFSNDIENDWSWLGLPKIRALDGVRGKRQGVASECCLKPCSISELMTYC
ncbi:bombyxin A-1 homolog [Galleria mellonella]|uniref:Bombyxin A-1 homolog n=1 Tax=Galleria mellonella TaxID=7137 RepID=A0A6J3C2E7_GALME|nr:bombyxin A-1 homolog [Galleria mellonella]WLY76843.1 insulin-like peptide transcript variant X7 [Galleria mellonella]